ncbi:hypothetical protein, partial [uncultured Psychroserpens sp.]|uniref:hypothetical protein n=1 Tax=uncultured Psychroserpens sp. TaxID=255436 RepID=UPI00262C77FC
RWQTFVMSERTILLIGVIAGLLFFRQTKPLLLKIILLALALSFGLSYLDFSGSKGVSLTLFGLISFFFGAYSLIEKKWLSLVITVFTFISIVHGFMYWPYYSELRFSQILPLVCYIIMWIKWKTQLEVMSIITIFTTYLLISFLSLFQ